MTFHFLLLTYEPLPTVDCLIWIIDASLCAAVVFWKVKAIVHKAVGKGHTRTRRGLMTGD